MKGLVLLIVLAAAVRPADAQPKPATPTAADVARAAELYEVGKRHFDLAEFEAAIDNWRGAYRLSSEPLLLFNIAQAYRLSGDCAQANRFYLSYKRVQPKPVNRAELDAAMQKCAGVEPATGNSADVKVEPPPETVEPPPAPKPSPPDPRPVSRPVAPAPPVVVGESVDRPKRHWPTLQIAGIATLAVGGVVGVLAVTSALSARSHAADISNAPTGTEWDDRLAEIERDGKAARTRSLVFTAVSAAAIATGGTLWWLGRRQSRVRVEATVSASHTEVGVACAF